MFDKGSCFEHFRDLEGILCEGDVPRDVLLIVDKGPDWNYEFLGPFFCAAQLFFTLGLDTLVILGTRCGFFVFQ